jgi:hypothetical protein
MNKCKHKKYKWIPFSCSVICEKCGAEGSCSVSQDSTNNYVIELNDDPKWIIAKDNMNKEKKSQDYMRECLKPSKEETEYEARERIGAEPFDKLENDKSIDDIIEEFEKEFSVKGLPEQIQTSYNAVIKEEGVFLRQSLSDYRDSLYTEWKKINFDDVPMGVSQWQNYGHKFGYWEFFEKKIFEGTEKQVRDSMCDYWYEKGKEDLKKEILENTPQNIEIELDIFIGFDRANKEWRKIIQEI